MKVTLIAALLAYTAMASQQATQMRAVSQTDALQNMIMTECAFVDAPCLSAAKSLLETTKASLMANDDAMMEKAAADYADALGASPACSQQLSSCSQKIGPGFTEAHGPKHSM
ncbi:hypothetical protein LEL_06178 [Akanthomyces lecanii RCEF 1005]|uniref:Uncharacterized protein n=1 Tax=Akanthomyces lecanii RCEF 1005 TaxID=1081108 RepID=A0A168GHH4_CORDF|nr:hypothetical protein LEL_06178 [Akanthomyces lecanii RCEF 1005]